MHAQQPSETLPNAGATHSPLPLSSRTLIRRCLERKADAADTTETEAAELRNAYEQLVQLSNSHSVLVEALRDCLQRLEHVTSQEDSFKSIQLSGRDCRDRAIEAAKAALDSIANPLTATRDFSIAIDDEPAGTIEQLIALPENKGAFSARDIATMRALQVGQAFTYAGGAAGNFTITRTNHGLR